MQPRTLAQAGGEPSAASLFFIIIRTTPGTSTNFPPRLLFVWITSDFPTISALGQHFPRNSPSFANIPSTLYTQSGSSVPPAIPTESLQARVVLMLSEKASSPHFHTSYYGDWFCISHPRSARLCG